MNDMKNDMLPNKFVTQGKTKLVSGSILSPELGNLRLILVPCGESGLPDSSLHRLLNKKWRSVAIELKGWYSSHVDFKLGNIQSIAVNSDIWVIHALCFDKNGKLDENAFISCIKKITDLCKNEKANLHVSTLTSNDITDLPKLLTASLLDKGIPVYYYQETE